MLHLELIFLHSESADGCNARRVRTADRRIIGSSTRLYSTGRATPKFRWISFTRSNLPLYPAVHAYFRQYRPPTLIVWGKNDKIFPADGAYPYKRDLPEVEFNLIDTGLRPGGQADEMVPLIRDFLGQKVK
jgi:pimeloyl-ACP methyl ester carboxylesterase